MTIVKVSANASLPDLSSAIVGFVKNEEDIELRAIGAGAVNQMYKALARARGELAVGGKDLFIKPAFRTITNDKGEEKTAMAAIIVIK